MQLLGLHWSSTHRHAPGSFIYNIRSGGSDRKELCCDLTLSLPSWGVLMNTGCKFSTKIPIPWVMNIQEVLPVSTNSFSSAFHSVERTCYDHGSTAKLQTQEQLCKEPMCLLKMRGCGDLLGVPCDATHSSYARCPHPSRTEFMYAQTTTGRGTDNCGPHWQRNHFSFAMMHNIYIWVIATLWAVCVKCIELMINSCQQGLTLLLGGFI